jgi:hypothetical protein
MLNVSSTVVMVYVPPLIPTEYRAVRIRLLPAYYSTGWIRILIFTGQSPYVPALRRSHCSKWS